MAFAHPFDHAVWSALNGRHAQFALMHGRARRYDRAYGVFAAVEDQSDASLAGLAALVAEHGDVAFMEGDPPGEAPSVAVASQALGVQMIATCLTRGPSPDFVITPLAEIDAPEMLALATLTEPGPFFARTH